MMDSNSHCDPCLGEGTSLKAIRFCSDCEERLCKDCVEYHKKFKATKSHHLIDLTLIVKSKLPIVKNICEIHSDIRLDFYCTQHDAVCCRACIPTYHQSCKDVLPLEVASKHIKKSTLFGDTLCEWQNIGKTLDLLRQDQNKNVNELEKVESSILVEVSKWEDSLTKQIKTSRERIKTDLLNAKKKNLDRLGKQKSEISDLYDVVKEKRHELEFLKEHGSNGQLYLTLQEHGKGVQNVVERVQEMILSYKKVVLQFVKAGDIDIKSIGSILETKEACDIQCNPVKFQQAQDQPGRVTSPSFIKDITVQLNIPNRICITDVAVTTDNKVLFCNYDEIYVYNEDNLSDFTTLSLPSYPYGISILTGTDKAVVTLPYESYIQFINTKSLTLDKTIQVGQSWFGITTSENYIAVGKAKEIKILKQNEEIIKTIVLSDLLFSEVCSLLYNHQDGSIIFRKKGQVRSIKLDGTVLYQYKVSGEGGLARDSQGHVYVSKQDENEVQCFLPVGRFRDVVLTGIDGMSCPYALTFNERCTKLFVTNTSGLVQIYTCK